MPTKQLDDRDIMILRGAEQRKTFREMGQDIGRSPSVVHGMVEELKALGLLNDPDGKARSVTLTEKGKIVLQTDMKVV